MGGRHARGLGRGPGTLVRWVASRVKVLSFAHAMVLLAVAVIVSSVVVGWILLSGGGPKDFAGPPAPAVSTPAHSRPQPRVKPRPGKPTQPAQVHVTPTTTPSTSATKSPAASTTSCPPGLRKRLCKHGPRA
jgi:hypothetical protein